MDSDDESCLESGENGAVLISDASMLHVLALEEEDGLLCSGSECGICCKLSLVLAGNKIYFLVNPIYFHSILNLIRNSFCNSILPFKNSFVVIFPKLIHKGHSTVM